MTRSRQTEIEVDGEVYKVVDQFPVMWSGWELDDIAYIVNHEGKDHVVFTNHNTPYFPDSQEINKKLDEYKNAAEQLGVFLYIKGKNQ